jgi:hypothetical protein
MDDFYTLWVLALALACCGVIVTSSMRHDDSDDE